MKRCEILARWTEDEVQDVLELWKGRPEWSSNSGLGRTGRFSYESDESK